MLVCHAITVLGSILPPDGQQDSAENVTALNLCATRKILPSPAKRCKRQKRIRIDTDPDGPALPGPRAKENLPVVCGCLQGEPASSAPLLITRLADGLQRLMLQKRHPR